MGFEKPMGLWAILEEESLFPKATDKSFEEKLKASLGKLPIFLKPASKTDKNAHFGISHYAGIVNYNVTGWLEKNKDPVNDTVVEIFKSTSKSVLLNLLWADHPGQPTTAPKEPGEVEPPLIMHQLTCNGVLEGIRICMRGFPNRIMYPDFKQRYSCLASAEINSSSDNKTAVYALMDKINFDRDKYRLGHTKVFFKAGALAALEEARDELVVKWIRWFQGRAYGYIKREYVFAKKY